MKNGNKLIISIASIIAISLLLIFAVNHRRINDNGPASFLSPSTQFTDDSRYHNRLVRSGRGLVGYFTYGTNQERTTFGDWQNPNRDGHADCSSFVWLAMKRAGYNVSQYPFATAMMEKDAKLNHHYFRQISRDQVHPCDVIIVNRGSGANYLGHTAIIDGPYKGLSTQIIEIGGDDSGPVHRSTIGSSFSGLLQSDGRVTYARPIQKG